MHKNFYGDKLADIKYSHFTRWLNKFELEIMQNKEQLITKSLPIGQ